MNSQKKEYFSKDLSTLVGLNTFHESSDAHSLIKRCGVILLIGAAGLLREIQHEQNLVRLELSLQVSCFFLFFFSFFSSLPASPSIPYHLTNIPTFKHKQKIEKMHARLKKAYSQKTLKSKAKTTYFTNMSHGMRT